MTIVLDFTERDISGKEVLAAGAIGCCRYILNAPGSTLDKEIHAAEVAEKSAAGCRIAANFEWGETPADTISKGQEHANAFLQWHQDVNSQLGAKKIPDWVPCYFSQDANNPAGKYHNYFTGVVREIGLARSGMYGNGACYRSLLQAGLVSLTWQSKSHSYAGNSATGPWPDTNLVQLLATKVVGGHQVDVNTVLTAYWGGWLLGEEDPMALDGTDADLVADHVLTRDGKIQNYGNPADQVSLATWSGQINTALHGLADAVAALKAGGATIDYTALAKAVNDDAARRLQS